MQTPFLSICREAFRRNRIPALVLQSFAALLLILYFLVPASRPAFDVLGEAKLLYGYRFSAISGLLFGGFIPWLVLWHRGRIPPGQTFRQLLFFTIFWSCQGMIVDTLYRQQAVWFGEGSDPKTLALKVLVDQLPFNLLWGTPSALFFYTWKDNLFSFSNTMLDLRVAGWHRFASVQLSAWMIWIPAVTMIYSLPSPLQIPLFNLVLCFFTLILAFVSRETR